MTDSAIDELDASVCLWRQLSIVCTKLHAVRPLSPRFDAAQIKHGQIKMCGLLIQILTITCTPKSSLFFSIG